MSSVRPISTDAASSRARGALLLLCVFGAGWVVVEDVFARMLEQQYDLLEIVWIRYAVHLLIVAVVFGWREPRAIWRTKRPVFHILRSLLMLLMPLSFVLSLAVGNAPSAVWAIFWVSPVMIVMISAIAEGARPSALSWAAAVAGSAGAMMIFGLAMPRSWLDFGPPLLMAFSFAAYVGMTRSLRREPVSTNMFYTAAGVFAVLTVYVPGVWTWPSWHDAALLVGIGSVGFVSLLALDRAAAWGNVANSAPGFYFQVLCVVAVGVTQSYYRANLATLLGCALIGVALVLAWRPFDRSVIRHGGARLD